MFLIVNTVTNERKEILDRVNALIDKRKVELFKRLPSIHEIDDGIIIRFFTGWGECNDNKNIRFKKIINEDNPEEILIFYYLPKGTIIELKKKDYIKSIVCLSGKLELNIEGKKSNLNGFKKISLESNEFQGIALENTYAITRNDV